MTKIPVEKIEDNEKSDQRASGGFDIKKIYQSTWKKADMSRLERKKKRPVKLIITIVAILAIIGRIFR